MKEELEPLNNMFVRLMMQFKRQGKPDKIARMLASKNVAFEKRKRAKEASGIGTDEVKS